MEKAKWAPPSFVPQTSVVLRPFHGPGDLERPLSCALNHVRKGFAVAQRRHVLLGT